MSEIELKEGELLCDQCEGRGTIPEKDDPFMLARMCEKCQGDGKVDWIENIMGKAPRQNYSTSGSSSMSSTFTMSGMNGTSFASKPDLNCLISDDALNKMGQVIADKIDKDILESIRGELEQKTDKMKAAAAVMNKIGGPAIDNGIISKFMLFFTTKPEVKAQENRSIISRCS